MRGLSNTLVDHGVPPDAAKAIVVVALFVAATAFVHAPRVVAMTELDPDLHRVTAEATVAVGRSWMAESLLPSLLRERADDDLIVHGPVILPADERAATRFERAHRYGTPRRARR